MLGKLGNQVVDLFGNEDFQKTVVDQIRAQDEYTKKTVHPGARGGSAGAVGNAPTGGGIEQLLAQLASRSGGGRGYDF
jgi:hypothetical protein